jgi:hypothetical protein
MFVYVFSWYNKKLRECQTLQKLFNGIVSFLGNKLATFEKGGGREGKIVLFTR